MVRTLTGNTTTAKNKADDVYPYNLLKVEWGGTVGTKWYGDRDWGNGDASAWNHAEGRVDSWGRITVKTSLYPRPAVGQVSIRLLDADQALNGFLDDEQLENKTVTVYQQFDGNAVGDLTIIHKGVVNSPVRWEEGRPVRALVFDITDMGSHYDREFATIADRDTFADVWDQDEGKMVPLVYGSVKRAPTLFAQAGKRGRLQNGIVGTDTSETFYIEGGEDFTQGSPVTIRIGQEHITGVFTGTAFAPSTRGATIASGTILGTTQNPRVFATNLTGAQGQYVGYFLRVQVAGHTTTGFQFRRIIRHGSGGEIEVAAPFYYQGFAQAMDEVATDFLFGVGQQYFVPAQTACTVITQARPHQEGELVVEVLAKYVYIANDRPSVATGGTARVDAVYGFGRKLPRNSMLDDIDGLRPGQMGMMNFQTMSRQLAIAPTINVGETPPGDFLGALAPMRDTWVPIDPSLYTVDRNDSTSFPGLDHRVTTITFDGLPPALMGLYDFASEELRVDVQGIDDDNDGSGNLITNPADVIEHFLKTIGGVSAGDVDATSFADAQGRMGGFVFGFSLQTPGTLVKVAQDLAFQARCALNWDDGAAHLRWLVNGDGTSRATISDSGQPERLLDSWITSHTDFETEVFSEVVAMWLEIGEEREVKVTAATAESAHGRKRLPIRLWALTGKADATVIANFWLRRLKDVLKIYRWSDYLNTLELQREDTVTLDVATYAPSGSKATLIEVDHSPGRGEQKQIDRIDYAALSWWCETSCEGFCETAGCETAMQVSVCSSTCETSCQGFCQQECVIGQQIICINSAQTAGCEWVETADPFGCDTTGTETATALGAFACTTGSCTTCGCQSCGCQIRGCESDGCQTDGCETIGCESCGCQTCGCESVCQTGCTTACQTSGCETHCEYPCTSGPCEHGCQNPIEACYTVCQVAGCVSDAEGG